MKEEEQQHILEEWLDRYKGLLFKIIRAYAVSVMDQDDLFQEIVIQVWRSIPGFRKEAAVSTWIYRIAINTAIKWVTKEKRHSPAETLGDAQHLLHETRSPVDERLEWLYREIHELNEIDRSLALLLLDGFSYREMATILGITETNVGVKINRIKKQLIAKSKKYEHHGI